MPLIQSHYTPPLPFRNPHLATIVPALFRPAPSLPQKRERLWLSDSDFVDLDWIAPEGTHLVIITHGLEGSSQSGYVRCLAHLLATHGFAVLTWSFRGCSGEPNRKAAWYHSGKFEDLRDVIAHVAPRYGHVSLVGFSVGGNVTLKYLCSGECAANIYRAVAISVPIDLAASAKQLGEPRCRVYMQWFLSHLRHKVRQKAHLFEELLTAHPLHTLKNFYDYDKLYTAPLNGYSSPEEYWREASARFVLDRLHTPCLLLTARDDPFLTPECIPDEFAAQSDYLFLETPMHGGHVGFASAFLRGSFYHEQRALQFLQHTLLANFE